MNILIYIIDYKIKMIAFDPEPKYTTEYMINQPDIDRGDCFVYMSSKDIVIIDDFLTKNSCKSLRDWIDNEENKEIIHTRWSEKNLDKKKLCRQWDFPIDIIELAGPISVPDMTISYVNPCWRFVKNFPKSSLSYHFDWKYIKSVDCMSKYTLMIYLSDHSIEGDGQLEIKDGKDIKFIEPKEGRLVIFNQDLLHKAQQTSVTKYFIRSEIIFKRIKSVETYNDKIAVKLFEEAILCYYDDPERSSQIEKEAYQLSPLLENIVFS